MLRSVDCIAAEDTRHTRKLLTHFDIRCELVRYDEHTHDRAAPKLLQLLGEGRSVAQVTDAGMPGISDPGVALIAAAREAGIAVEVIPGPEAVTTALLLSGLPTAPYTFHGFAPRKGADRRRLLAALPPGTHVFYESPVRATALLETVRETWPAAPVAVCRELTKKFERVTRGTAAEVLAQTGEGERGEVVLVLYAAEPAPVPVEDATLRAAVDTLVQSGIETKRAVKQVADTYGVPKRRVYALTHRAGAPPG